MGAAAVAIPMASQAETIKPNLVRTEKEFVWPWGALELLAVTVGSVIASPGVVAEVGAYPRRPSSIITHPEEKLKAKNMFSIFLTVSRLLEANQ